MVKNTIIFGCLYLFIFFFFFVQNVKIDQQHEIVVVCIVLLYL
jgi:predicted RND superfamily exporter protein